MSESIINSTNNNQLQKQADKKSASELGQEFFKQEIYSIIEELLTTDEEWSSKYDKDTKNNDNLLTLEETIKVGQTIRHPSDFFPEIHHLEVFQQHKGGLCGFHAYYNAKCFIQSVISQKRNERLQHIINLKLMTKFWKHYNYVVDILLKSNNKFYINNQDKKELKKNNQPLERNHLRYLLLHDKEISEMKKNNGSVKVYMKLFLYGFGLIQHGIEDIKDLEWDIEEFRNTKQEAVFCLFLGIVNHWDTLVVYKQKNNSTNLVFLDKPDDQIPNVMEERNKAKQKLGLPESKDNKFMMKMSTHMLFDQRKVFEIMLNVFSGKHRLCQYLTHGHVHNILKHFHQFTESFNTEKLEVPKNNMFAQVKQIQNIEQNLPANDEVMSEFMFPYVQVKGNFEYLLVLNDHDSLSSLVDLIVMYINACHRPKHIEVEFLRPYYAFGIECFFTQDLDILKKWCLCLIEINKKLQQYPQILKKQETNQARLFQQLITLASTLVQKFQKSR